ncbi:unnamed protein product, partial [Mycena citricolor]
PVPLSSQVSYNALRRFDNSCLLRHILINTSKMTHRCIQRLDCSSFRAPRPTNPMFWAQTSPETQCIQAKPGRCIQCR